MSWTLICLLFVTHAFGAADLTIAPSVSASEWVVRSWKTEDGLPQNTVNAVLQTRDGFLWVGTSGGLARFDGARFRKFGLQDGLRSVEIFRLAEDRDGVLWVGTVGGGISRWENGRFTTFGPAEGFTVGMVHALQPDRDGSLWIGGELGLVKWSDGKFKSIGAAEGLPKGQIRALAQDTNGTLWVSVYLAGLFHGADGRFVSEGTTSTVPTSVLCLMANRDGSIWAGSQAVVWRGHAGNWMRLGRTNGFSTGTALTT